MKTTVTTAEAKTNFSRLLRQVEAGETIAISKHDETVAFLVPRARLEALVETMEILGNPAAMKAILGTIGHPAFFPIKKGQQNRRASIRRYRRQHAGHLVEGRGEVREVPQGVTPGQAIETTAGEGHG